jgi:mono/diheme cytochrome c family protein
MEKGIEMEEAIKKLGYIGFCLILLSGAFSVTEWAVPSVCGASAVASDTGKRVYEERCMLCHGDKGDGQGLVGNGIMRREERSGRILTVYARDFTKGVFRFRSTSSGCMPIDNDLLSIIDKGIPISFMPAFKEIPPSEKNAVKNYIKTFSARWKEEEPCKPIAVKKPGYVGSESSIEKGKKLYDRMKCWECHGQDGKGKGPKSDTLKDDWGKLVPPFNFVTGQLKRGSTPENVYITFTTGLDGTAMPSYEDSLKEDDRWHLVSYTLKLMGMVK